MCKNFKNNLREKLKLKKLNLNITFLSAEIMKLCLITKNHSVRDNGFLKFETKIWMKQTCIEKIFFLRAIHQYLQFNMWSMTKCVIDSFHCLIKYFNINYFPTYFVEIIL